MHWQKSGRDIGNCAAATWQLWLRAGLFLNELFVNFNIAILKNISTGLDQQRIPCPSPMQNVGCNLIEQ